MKSHEIIKELKSLSNSAEVKVEINGVLYDIKDIIWTGYENEGVYKIKLDIK